MPTWPVLLQHGNTHLACSSPAWEHPPGLFSSSMGTPIWPVIPLGVGPNPLTLYGSQCPVPRIPHPLRFLLPYRIWAIQPGPGSLLRPRLTEIQRPLASLPPSGLAHQVLLSLRHPPTIVRVKGTVLSHLMGTLIPTEIPTPHVGTHTIQWCLPN